MFNTKIQSIESQIQTLTKQLNQYRTLENELTAAVSAIARLTETAVQLSASDEVLQALSTAVGVAKMPVDNGLQHYVQEYEAKLVNRELRVSRLEEQFASVAKERDEKNAEIADLRNAIALLEQKLEFQLEPQPEVDELGIVEEEEFLAENTQISEAEARASILPPEPVQLSIPTSINVGDLVECPSGKIGHVTYKCIMQDKEMITVTVPGGSVNYHATSLKYLGKYQEPTPVAITIQPASDIPYSKIQETARDLYSFKTWAQIRAVLQSFSPATKGEILREMAITANNKTKIKFIENLPSMISKYCEKGGDRSDLEWLPDVVVTKIEELLGQVSAA